MRRLSMSLVACAHARPGWRPETVENGERRRLLCGGGSRVSVSCDLLWHMKRQCRTGYHAHLLSGTMLSRVAMLYGDRMVGRGHL